MDKAMDHQNRFLNGLAIRNTRKSNVVSEDEGLIFCIIIEQAIKILVHILCLFNTFTQNKINILHDFKIFILFISHFHIHLQ